jgi:hypothetical protein
MDEHHALTQLSLTARLAVALHCVERYCLAHGLTEAAITEFLNYLWQFPTISTPDAFAVWESNTPVRFLPVAEAFPLQALYEPWSMYEMDISWRGLITLTLVFLQSDKPGSG